VRFEALATHRLHRHERDVAVLAEAHDVRMIEPREGARLGAHPIFAAAPGVHADLEHDLAAVDQARREMDAPRRAAPDLVAEPIATRDHATRFEGHGLHRQRAVHRVHLFCPTSAWPGANRT
jgi:hypothetical protein